MRGTKLARGAIVCAALLYFLAPRVGYAQSTFGTIRGVVKDPAGALIAGARVKVMNEGTNIEKAASSDALGNYEITHLNPGPYSVAVEAPGFQRYLHQHINLETSQILRVDVQMVVGQTTETVTVTAQAPVLDAETGTVSDVRTGFEMRELPLSYLRGDAFNGGIFRYIGLTPGGMRYEGSGAASFAGSRTYQNTFMADGISLGDQGGNHISSTSPSLEAIQEVKITMLNNSAQYANVATVAVTTRSGTNQLHGGAFHQYTGGSLSAREPFLQPQGAPFRVYNDFGATVGGPVVLPGYDGRNRTFFFVGYEGNRNHGRRTYLMTVPTEKMRQGDFSEIATPIKDPLTGRQFTGNIIPASRVSLPPSSAPLKLQDKYIPHPTSAGLFQNFNKIFADRPVTPYWNQVDARVDHKINEQNSLYGRFTWRNIPVPFCFPCLPQVPEAAQARRVRNLALVDTHVFSPRLINELRAGFNWHENRVDDRVKGLEVVNELGIKGLPSVSPDTPGLPAFTITGFDSVSTYGSSRGRDDAFNVFDDVTWVGGRHSLKTGFQFVRNRYARGSIGGEFGAYNFTGSFTGHAYADFLLGLPKTTFRVTSPPRIYGRNYTLAGYIQDDFKVSPNLTLNLGLRYEWGNPWKDKYDLLANFDLATGKVVVPTQAVLDRDVPVLQKLLPAGLQFTTAQQIGFPRHATRGDGNNFDPRFGLAWRPFGNARTVIRGGFGIYHNSLFSDIHSNVSAGLSLRLQESHTNNLVGGAPLFQFPEPFGSAGVLGSTQNFNTLNPNISNPYTMQWNLTVEQQYEAVGLRASYIATRSVNLLYKRDVNQIPASTNKFDPAKRPFPLFNNITMTDNGANTMYHALQLEAERKMSKGLYFQGGWTWAKQLSHGNDGSQQGTIIENAFDRNPEWGDELWLHRHRFVSSFVWELPLGPGRALFGDLRGVAGHIVGGWEISGGALFQTGQRFTPNFTGSDPSNTNKFGGRPDRIANGNLPTDQRTTARWFDASAFAVPPAGAGRFGNSGVGVLEGPGTNAFNLGLYKNFRLGENSRLQLQGAATNAFNHPNFRNPSSNISAPNAVGRIPRTQVEDSGGPRVITLGARIDF